MMNNCHCSMCRKAHGTAFGSFLHVSTDGFQWISGKEQIKTYRAPNQDDRCFCSNCGSSVPVIEKDNNVIIPAGTLDSDPGIKPIAHIFTGSKAPWYDITDSLPQFEEFAPEAWIRAALERK
ncbi:MAG: GFA family protein [Candidatus Thiodiazotropha sp.]